MNNEATRRRRSADAAPGRAAGRRRCAVGATSSITRARHNSINDDYVLRHGCDVLS